VIIDDCARLGRIGSKPVGHFALDAEGGRAGSATSVDGPSVALPTPRRLLCGDQFTALNVAEGSKSPVHLTVTNDRSRSDSAVDLARSNRSSWPLLPFTDSHEIAPQNQRQIAANA
jgi:hypothetical protein